MALIFSREATGARMNARKPIECFCHVKDTPGDSTVEIELCCCTGSSPARITGWHALQAKRMSRADELPGTQNPNPNYES